MRIVNRQNTIEFNFGTEKTPIAMFTFYKNEPGMNQCLEFIADLKEETDPSSKDMECFRLVEHACNEFLSKLKPMH